MAAPPPPPARAILALLLALLLSVSPSTASPDPVAAALPAPSPWDSPAPLDPRGLTVPLVRNPNPRRLIAIEDWAVREREKLYVKYGAGRANQNVERAIKRNAEEEQERRRLRERDADRRRAQRQSTSSGGSSTSSAFAPSNTPNGTGQWVGKQELVNSQQDLEYYAPIEVGTPPQVFNVVLDTGSADTWLASSNCSSCDSVVTFTPNTSSTATSLDQQFSITYGHGFASGALWKDQIMLAGSNASAGFAVCDNVSSELLSGDVSGLMGLGWQTLAASGQIPLWQSLASIPNGTTGALAFQGFSFYLSRYVNVSYASLIEPGGLFTLGNTYPSLYDGDINWVDIPTGLQSYWIVPLAGMTVNGTSPVGLGTPNVAMDTGTTLVGGPPSVIQAIYNLIPGSQAATGAYAGYYTYPCSVDANVNLTFGNETYTISPEDFNLGPFGGNSTCLGAFFDIDLPTGSESLISWVIGVTFLKNVYSVYRYDPPSVGFAHLVWNASSTYPTFNGTNATRGTSEGIFPPSSSASHPPPTGTSSPDNAPPTTTKSSARRRWRLLGADGAGVPPLLWIVVGLAAFFG